MRFNKKLSIVLGISFAIVSAAIGSYFIITSLRTSLRTPEESFDSKIQKLMADYKIPSLAAGIVSNESVIWARGFGEQPDLDTVYMIGSITKTFTATAILQLKERNLINLDGNISNYLPFDVAHPDYPGTAITIRMLLTHTSGLQTNLYWSLEYYFDNQTIDWINENLDLGGDIVKWTHRPTLEEFLNGSLNPAGPYYNSYNWYTHPGTTFHYSNAGFQLLGYLVQQVANQSLADYVQENIFDPLNMSNSGYYYSDFIEKHAIPYEWYNGSNMEYPLYNINVTGAGSIRSSVLDMAKYMITYLNQGDYTETQLLNPGTVELMHSIQIPFSGTSTEGFEYVGYGLGWNLFSGDRKGHGGATPGYSSHMILKTGSVGNFGVIVMFNRGSAFIYDEILLNEVLPAINQLLYEHAENLFQ
ncbi:MAG: serine hydrolase domain-containing protein [Promethearchaeota archaeon]|jgi:CubicO group peptidase (beta-lactamase class C family)